METSKKKNGKGETTSTFSPSQICVNNQTQKNVFSQYTNIREVF